MVQTLTTMLMTYDQKPSCLIVAKSLVHKHDFLKDRWKYQGHVQIRSLNITKIHVQNSWKWFNRKVSEQPTCSPAKKPKKNPRVEKHQYPIIPDDETSVERNVKKKQKKLENRITSS